MLHSDSANAPRAEFRCNQEEEEETEEEEKKEERDGNGESVRGGKGTKAKGRRVSTSLWRSGIFGCTR